MKQIIFFLLVLSLQIFAQINRPLKILFVTGGFPDVTETFILNQITTLLDRGHDVYIYANGRGKMDKIHADIEKYNLLDRTFYKIPLELAPFDVVCCQFGYLARKVMRKHKELGNNIVVCFRGTDITEYVRKRPKSYSRLFRYARRRGKNIFYLPVCTYFKKILRAMGGPLGRVIVHPSAIDCNDLAYKKRNYKNGDTVKLLCVARFVVKKGHKNLLHALALVIKKHPKIHLTLAGGGKLQGDIEQLIEKLNLQKHVTLFGWATKQEVKELFADAHIFALASRTSGSGNKEGIPNVLKEAMASGVPVVSTIHSGIPDLITHNVTGMLGRENDHQTLAKNIMYLIEHPEKWDVMTRRARAVVENEYHIDVVIDKFEQLLYKLIWIGKKMKKN